MTRIVEAIMGLYEQTEQTYSRRRLPSASDGLASVCPRLAWYEYNTNVPTVFSPYLKRRFKYGNLHEDHIVDELSTVHTLDAFKDWRIKGSQLNISMWGRKGKIDLLVKEDNEWKMLEIKTMSPESFKLFKAEGLEGFPRYKEQATYYLAGLGQIPFVESERITKGILLAENTFPLGELHALEFTLDKELVAKMEQHTKELDDIVLLPSPPPRPFAKDSRVCTYCKRREQCWGLSIKIPRSIEYIHLKDPQTFATLMTNFLRAKNRRSEVKDIYDEASEQYDESKVRLREILEAEEVTQVIFNPSDDIEISVSMTKVEVAEHLVRASEYVRVDVRGA
jgi:CRISPR/Cas system-associated exonuclease Cas4 (RecB family)